MAVVINPALSMAASGNLGGVCYSRWRGMHIARSAWSGSYSGTSLQIASNARMTTVSQYWGTSLTSIQRQRWKDAARVITWFNRLAQPYNPTGYNYFVKLALQQLQLDMSITKDPPPAVPGYDVSDFSSNNSVVNPQVVVKMITYDNLQIAHKGFQILKAGPFDNDGYTPMFHDYRYYQKVTASKSYRDEDIINGKWYWYRARWFELTGQVGNWWLDNVLVDFP